MTKPPEPTGSPRIVELYGVNTGSSADWKAIVERQHCPFSNKRCFKIRKSDPSVSIGTCTIRVGKQREPLIICPNRLLEKGQVFADCLHLLTRHQPGQELHLVPEVTIPGGSVDYFLASAIDGRVVDFVGIEFQTMDTTGTVWPSRQAFLRSVGLGMSVSEAVASGSYGVNWKMTAKTILMQLLHKVETFQAVGRNFVLVIQRPFMEYMTAEFDFGHLRDPAVIGDAMHFHSYDVRESATDLSLALHSRKSTTAAGIAKALNLGTDSVMEEAEVLAAVTAKISENTRWAPFG